MRGFESFRVDCGRSRSGRHAGMWPRRKRVRVPPVTPSIRGSFNGRTTGFGPVDRGSTPCPRTAALMSTTPLSGRCRAASHTGGWPGSSPGGATAGNKPWWARRPHKPSAARFDSGPRHQGECAGRRRSLQDRHDEFDPRILHCPSSGRSGLSSAPPCGPCRHGGTGRHPGLRHRFRQSRSAGSTPAVGTALACSSAPYGHRATTPLAPSAGRGWPS